MCADAGWPTLIAASEESQFDHGGVSACTGIDLALAIAVLVDGAALDNETIRNALRRGSELVAENEHQSALDLHEQHAEIASKLQLIHQSQYSIRIEGYDIALTLVPTEIGDRDGEAYCVVMTKPPGDSVFLPWTRDGQGCLRVDPLRFTSA
eukprot:EC687062.1.p1 GENE.EC687062.1~~EC687062.1.p1  ORF type:complete len:152 (+),score=62.21 EC687062.1:52-507(+)